jgi:hypothetical protein
MAQFGREHGVAGVDDVLHIADEMGEADLISLAGLAHLPAIAIRHPEVRPEQRHLVVKPIRMSPDSDRPNPLT